MVTLQEVRGSRGQSLVSSLPEAKGVLRRQEVAESVEKTHQHLLAPLPCLSGPPWGRFCRRGGGLPNVKVSGDDLAICHANKYPPPRPCVNPAWLQGLEAKQAKTSDL